MITATLSPRALRDGSALLVRLSGLVGLPTGPAVVRMVRVDTIETGWVASLASDLRPDGALEANWVNVQLGREAAIHASSVEAAGTVHNIEASDVAIVNASALIATAADAEARRAELQRRQDARYAASIGDATAADAREHRVVFAIERLLVAARLRLPGVIVEPISERPSGDEQRLMVDHVMGTLGWPTRVNQAWWTQQVAAGRPWTAIVCAPVYAKDFDEAAQLAWSVRGDLLAVLGLNRGARGRPVATVIEQRQPDDSIKHRIYVEDARYQGNLAGGFTSGEDQTQLLAQQAAMRSDPLLRLCVDLYAEALADPSHDARYLRLWSVVETLSGARVPAGQTVTRLDGTTWPGSNSTTDFAAPRVYALIASVFQLGSVDESSSIAPASDLYEAVRGWYARRNATGHYGRFDPADARQQAQPWFARAQQTVSSGEPRDRWLMTFEHITALVLNRELMSAGRSAIQ